MGEITTRHEFNPDAQPDAALRSILSGNYGAPSQRIARGVPRREDATEGQHRARVRRDALSRRVGS